MKQDKSLLFHDDTWPTKFAPSFARVYLFNNLIDLGDLVSSVHVKLSTTLLSGFRLNSSPSNLV